MQKILIIALDTILLAISAWLIVFSFIPKSKTKTKNMKKLPFRILFVSSIIPMIIGSIIWWTITGGNIFVPYLDWIENKCEMR